MIRLPEPHTHTRVGTPRDAGDYLRGGWHSQAIAVNSLVHSCCWPALSHMLIRSARAMHRNTREPQVGSLLCDGFRRFAALPGSTILCVSATAALLVHQCKWAFLRPLARALGCRCVRIHVAAIRVRVAVGIARAPHGLPRSIRRRQLLLAL